MNKKARMGFSGLAIYRLSLIYAFSPTKRFEHASEGLGAL